MGWWWAAVVAVAAYWLVPDALWHHAQWGALAGSREQERVALTFDDGPGPQTGAVLDALAARGVHATFFVVAARTLSPQGEALVRRMVAEGHEVALHGWVHRSSYLMGPWASWQQFARAYTRIAALTGQPPRWYRPPWGQHNLVTGWVSRRLGLTAVLWDIAPDDWRRDRTASAIVEYVAQLALPGTIVVLHDGGGDRRRTVQALPALIDRLRELDLEPGPVGALAREHSLLRRVWTWWEIRFTRAYAVDTVPMGPGVPPVLRIGRIRYRGPRLPLPEGGTLADGDPFGEIHFGNPALAQFSKDARLAVKALREVRLALGRLAERIAVDPKYADVRAVGGITLLDAAHAIERLGFSRAPVQGPGKWPRWVYLTVLMAVYHRQGWRVLRRFFRLRPVWVYMEREAFLRRYRSPGAGG